MNERIGELLVKENLLTAEQLREAANRGAAAKGGRLGAQITQLGFLEESELTDFVAKQYGVPSINLDEFEIDPAVIQLVPEEVAQKHNVVPVNRAGSTLILATSDPSNIFALDDIKFLTGYNIQPVVAAEEAIKRGHREVLRPERPRSTTSWATSTTPTSTSSRTRTTSTPPSWRRASEDAPVVKLVNLILTDASRRRVGHPHRALREDLPRPLPHRRRPLRGDEAADEAQERDHLAHQDHVRARHRRAPAAPGRPHQAEDGRGREMDFRVSVLPTLFGEKIVLRLLDKSNLQLDMTKLGFERAARRLQGLASTSPSAWCWSPAPPVRARPPRSTRRCRS